MDGKALKGSARLDAPRRHLLSAVTHAPVATLAQVEVGAKTNETRHFKPLLAPLDLADTVVTFDALHSVKANITWLVETKKAHYIAVIKTNQPTAYAQLNALPWTSIKVQHTASHTAHGRRESRSIKTCSIAGNLGGIAFPHAALAIRVHRRRKPTGKPESRESVYAVTSLDSHQAGPPISPPPFADTGESKIPPTTSEMSPSPKTPQPFTQGTRPSHGQLPQPRHRPPPGDRPRGRYEPPAHGQPGRRRAGHPTRTSRAVEPPVGFEPTTYALQDLSGRTADLQRRERASADQQKQRSPLANGSRGLPRPCVLSPCSIATAERRAQLAELRYDLAAGHRDHHRSPSAWTDAVRTCGRAVGGTDRKRGSGPRQGSSTPSSSTERGPPHVPPAARSRIQE